MCSYDIFPLQKVLDMLTEPGVTDMYRRAIEQLWSWKNKPVKNPLLVRGAWQVDKTWLMKHFGQIAYEHTVYINFDQNRQMHDLFDLDLRVERLLTGLELYTGQKIQPDKTLLIFDEIQEVPKALTALKYFNEDAPEYAIICAESLLGVARQKGTSFPVGEDEFFDLFPMTFDEFMIAWGKELFVDLLQKKNLL